MGDKDVKKRLNENDADSSVNNRTTDNGDTVPKDDQTKGSPDAKTNMKGDEQTTTVAEDVVITDENDAKSGVNSETKDDGDTVPDDYETNDENDADSSVNNRTTDNGDTVPKDDQTKGSPDAKTNMKGDEQTTTVAEDVVITDENDAKSGVNSETKDDGDTVPDDYETNDENDADSSVNNRTTDNGDTVPKDDQTKGSPDAKTNMKGDEQTTTVAEDVVITDENDAKSGVNSETKDDGDTVPDDYETNDENDADSSVNNRTTDNGDTVPKDDQTKGSPDAKTNMKGDEQTTTVAEDVVITDENDAKSGVNSETKDDGDTVPDDYETNGENDADSSVNNRTTENGDTFPKDDQTKGPSDAKVNIKGDAQTTAVAENETDKDGLFADEESEKNKPDIAYYDSDEESEKNKPEITYYDSDSSSEIKSRIEVVGGMISDEFRCWFCKKIMHNPIQLHCTHRMCLECLDDTLTNCFVCDEEICRDLVSAKKSTLKLDLSEGRLIQDNHFLSKFISDIRVRCGNFAKCCKWEGQLVDLDDHLESDCQYVILKCLNDDCPRKFCRHSLNDHKSECNFRQVNCQFCEETYIFNKRQDHFVYCKLYPLSCPNECGTTLPRSMLGEHCQRCPMEMVSCKFQQIGCEDKYPRKESDVHNELEMEKHLLFMQADHLRLKESLQQSVTHLHQLSTSHQELLLDHQQSQIDLCDLNRSHHKLQNDNNELLQYCKDHQLQFGQMLEGYEELQKNCDLKAATLQQDFNLIKNVYDDIQAERNETVQFYGDRIFKSCIDPIEKEANLLTEKWMRKLKAAILEFDNTGALLLDQTSLPKLVLRLSNDEIIKGTCKLATDHLSKVGASLKEEHFFPTSTWKNLQVHASKKLKEFLEVCVSEKSAEIKSKIQRYCNYALRYEELKKLLPNGRWILFGSNETVRWLKEDFSNLQHDDGGILYTKLVGPSSLFGSYQLHHAGAFKPIFGKITGHNVYFETNQISGYVSRDNKVIITCSLEQIVMSPYPLV